MAQTKASIQAQAIADLAQATAGITKISDVQSDATIAKLNQKFMDMANKSWQAIAYRAGIQDAIEERVSQVASESRRINKERRQMQAEINSELQIKNTREFTTHFNRVVEIGYK